MNHTPTPWVIANTGTDCPQISAPAKGDGYYSSIASVTQRDKHPLYGGEISTQEALANAQFIVRACNAHDELVAALTTIQAFSWSLPRSLREDDRWKIVDTAIAKAEGKEVRP